MGYDRDARRQSISLSLNEALVTEAGRYTEDLDRTLETLLDNFVQRERSREQSDAAARQQCIDGWNRYHTEHGLLSDELFEP